MKYTIKLLHTTLLLLAVALFTACLDSTDNSGFEPNAPAISFSEGSLAVEKGSSEVEVMLTSNLPWRIKNAPSWVALSAKNGSGSSTMKLTVKANPTTRERRGILTAYITDSSVATLVIVQAPAEVTEPIIYYVKTDGNALASGLTWEDATTLPTAMELVVGGDKICLAAGSYSPVALIPGGESEEEKTFEVHNNFTLEGGYPADATTGSEADPTANETILDGNLGSKSAYHVVTVTAPKPEAGQPDAKATLKNLTITGGVGYSTNEVLRRVAGNSIIDAAIGGGLFIGNSNVDVINCRITDNQACHSGGVHVYIGANANFTNCSIDSNTALNNGGGIWNQGAVVYMNGCTISGNASAQQAAGFYSIDSNGAKSISRVYNSLIADNDNTRSNAKRSGGGAYIREGSDALFVNCTFSGNKAGWGGGVNGYGSAARPSKTLCISCTITSNTANDGGGGLFVFNNNGPITAYNSIISGNTAPGDTAEAAVTSGNDASKLKIFRSIRGSQLLDASGAGVSGWSFTASTMLGSLSLLDGGTARSYPLVVSAENPAVGQGMSADELKEIGASSSPAVSDQIVTSDQNGAPRSGRSIGAVTAQ